ncbi:MAG: EpsD family peptidyl-prolyl cis-trans isomerase [Methylophaga sp.]
MNTTQFYRLFSALFITLLVGCDDVVPKTNTQVAATVNNEEITVHQLNQAIGSMGEKALNADQQALRASVLQNMIVQTLLEQEAEKSDLDREPYVMQSVEAAKRQVLASAYTQQLATTNSSISDAEIENYYSANTDLFANRKLFVYEQVTVQSDISKFANAQKKLQQIEDLTDFTAWLEKNAIPYKAITKATTSENIPQNLRKALSTLDIGQVGFLNLADGLVVFEIKDKQLQPVELDMVSTAIREHLRSQQRKEQVYQVVQSLKKSAVIKYSEDFEPSSMASKANTSDAMQNEMDLESFIEKGVAGIE